MSKEKLNDGRFEKIRTVENTEKSRNDDGLWEGKDLLVGSY